MDNQHPGGLPNPHPALGDCTTGFKTARIYLVGGGTSLQNFPIESLQGVDGKIFAINDGFLKIPWVDGVVSADSRWIQKRLPELRNWNGTPYLVCDPRPEIQHVVWYSLTRGLGYTDNANSVQVFGTSGFAAVVIATKLGFKEINLLGFDYFVGEKHWYENLLPWKTGAVDEDYHIWAKGFDSLVEPLRQRGVQVINWSLGSRITAFPKRPLKELLDELHIHRQS